MGDAEADNTSCRCELEGIRQDVGNHLVEVVAVNPDGQYLGVVLIAELDILRLGLLGEQHIYVAHEIDEVGLTHSHLHLSLVNLTEVHHLVNQSQNALGIPADGLVDAAPVWVVVLFHQGEQG